MKKYVLFFCLMVGLQGVVHAQQNRIAMLPIDKAYIDGTDRSGYYKEVCGAIVFYQGDDGALYMSNMMILKDTQSFGPVTERKKRFIRDFAIGRIDLLDFRWSYENDYDDKSGGATCRLHFAPLNTKTVFALEIRTDSGSVLQYEGVFVGSINELLEQW